MKLNNSTSSKTEEEILDDIFYEDKKWKNKYKISWCDLCECFTRICPTCKKNDCSCGGCEECIKDGKDWDKVKSRIEDYLTVEEKIIYEKCNRLRRHMKESIVNNENEINFKKLKEEGRLSKNEEELFKNFL